MIQRWDRRALTRYAIGAFYLLAGWQHLANPAPFVAITPDWVPISKGAVVFWTGIAELLGAALLLAWKQKARAVGAMMLALYALAVWPANFQHLFLDLERADGGLGLAYHILRLAAQPLLIWATLWSAGLARWPFAKNKRAEKP
ncbi:hypothetical protein P8Q88_00850 [Qipengyuania sp. XHP0207]|uniref:hypothetical protein n=1 Tax=Qipengyuania sp. XHP0207 TaxID=3038078 RepID=UPI00241F2C74|nr:hypothetical protein [Qipengyuania sp. XHP0207]MDG5746717.1 hypothetical protein [Qipengyuania sp. XHP0207]